MINFSLRVILCFIGLLHSFQVSAKEHVFVVFDEAVIPMQFQNKQGKADGLYPALIRAALSRLGYSFTFEALPWKRAIVLMEEGKAAVGGMYWNHKRDKVYDFSEPLYTERLMLIVKKGTKFEFNSINDLYGMTIGVNRGWSYGSKFDISVEEGSISTQIFPGNRQSLQYLVSRGELDAVIDLELGAIYMTRKLNIAAKVDMMKTPVTEIDTHIVFHKSAKKTELIKTINESLSVMKTNGTYQSILDKFL